MKPLDFAQFDRDFRRYVKRRGGDPDALLRDAGKHFTGEKMRKITKMTRAQAKAFVDFVCGGGPE